ncbi:MAG: hypothetical protein ACRC5M_05830, partial [Anaeroplasmataceae bacterium]
STKEKTEKDRKVDTLINKILDNAVVDVPQSLVNERVEQVKNQYEQQAKMYNMPLETLLGFMNTTLDALLENAKVNGERQVLFSLVMSKLIETEKLNPTDEDMKARAEKDVEATSKSVEDLIKENGDRYYNELSYDKVIEFILSNSKQV